MVRDPQLIVKRYFLKGMGFIDLVASFPFELIQTQNSSLTSYFDLLRITRVSRIRVFLDERRINH